MSAEQQLQDKFINIAVQALLVRIFLGLRRFFRSILCLAFLPKINAFAKCCVARSEG